MSIYKRGSVYWYKFMWYGELVRESTKQRNDRIARQMEAAHRTRLGKNHQLREEKAEQLGCDVARLIACAECDRLFNRDFAVVTGTGIKLCSSKCLKQWDSRQEPVPAMSKFCRDRVEPWAKSTFERTAPKTWLWYCFGINSVKNSAALGNRRLNEIGPELVAEFASERQRDGLQISSINSCLRALRRILRLAVEWGVIESAPKVKFLNGEHQRERVISEAEEACYLVACSPLLHDVSVVLFDTGLRPEECHCLSWEHVNWDGGRNGALLVARGKTKAARRILPMSPRVRLALAHRWNLAGKPGDGWVWPAETKDGHINHDTLKLQHKKALKLSKVRPFQVYSIRHTFLTRLGESGCDVWTLARIAGHSTISISQRYVHPSEDAVLKALSRLSGHNSGHSAERTVPAQSEGLLLKSTSARD